jgi:hypothetical protein
MIARPALQMAAAERRAADTELAAETPAHAHARLGSQTLLHGLDVIDVVAAGPIKLADLAARLGLTRSTTHRLASALTDRRYLSFAPQIGYSLGPKLLELGFRVRDELDLPRIAAPHLERLALLTAAPPSNAHARARTARSTGIRTGRASRRPWRR